ncbi:nuclear transport factor 2 family protein [Sphingobium sp. AP49]|uniref:nuclear transport factor 2 family protein n=1 Tax=Sphingobium sp. AP49 TaxID=1144307 RepID=UPI00026ECF08|nr:nuclear transport factor 2 family protein [Sphingobium sp. AP49]WHO37761.1 nuclear transport factor 2 family protein [Sphingobium sp. AP49]
MTERTSLPTPLKILFGNISAKNSPAHIRWALKEYGDLMSQGNAQGIVDLFAPDGVLLDPVGSQERRGKDLFDFYQGSFDAMGGFIEMRLDGEVRIAGDYGAAAYIARMTIDGQDVMVETLDVMKFDENGKFASTHAYWGPPNVKAGRKPEKLR